MTTRCTFAPGSIVAVGFYGFTHVGIVSDRYDDDGYPYVISASRREGCVVEESQADFSVGRNPYLVKEPHGCVAATMERARAGLGRPWDALNHNCEHFVSGVVEDAPRSVQLRIVSAVGAAAAAALVGLGRWVQ